MRKQRAHRLVFAILFLSHLPVSFSAENPGEELKVVIERNVPVPMRDGTILRADVRRPDRGGPYPVIVQRTVYGKNSGYRRPFLEAGYIVVTQDVRGVGESEGKWESNYRFQTHDAEDGYDTVEWAAKLPNSNGKVGTYGTSYPAFLQWRLAPLQPPSLVAMSACSIPAEIWYGETPCTIRPGFRLRWLGARARDMAQHENLPGVHTGWEYIWLWPKDSPKWLYWLPWLELPDDFFGHETMALKKWLKNPQRDPWKLDQGCKDIVVPNLDIVGWYDHAHGDMLLFRTMVREAHSKVARKGSRLIIGPWSHGWPQRSYGNIDFGPNAAINLLDVQIRWFDYWLKGVQNGLDKDAPVKIFVMGDNQWRDEQAWPVKRAKEKILFLNSQGNANTPMGDGELVDGRPEIAATDTYVYDPRNPVPTLYGEDRPIPVDQRPLADRKDILVYQFGPLTERIEVTGNPIVELYALTSAPDTDWFVRLIDVAPNGLARDVSSGMVRARYRNGYDKAEPIIPNEVVKYVIRMSPTSNAFLPKHRIRLDITSSDFPNYDRNHNTAGNQNAHSTLVVAKQTIFHGSKQASRIILPWVPNLREMEASQAGPAKDDTQFEQNVRLHEVADRGDLEQVKLLIEKGADVNSKDSLRMTPIEYAIFGDHKEVVGLLHTKGADISPLYLAVFMGNLVKIESAIANGADVNESMQSGTTPLLIAASEGFKDIVELLIHKGADVNVKNPWGWTPLHYVVDSGDKHIAQLLIASEANVNAQNRDGWTPLHYALWKGYPDLVKLLVENGADVNIRGPGSNTTLMWAVRSMDKKALANILAANIVPVNNKNSRGQTPLEVAIERGFTDGVELLIANGAHFEVKLSRDFLPLGLATLMNAGDIVRLLLTKGAKVDGRDDIYEFTALHYAARFGTTKVAEVLIAHGADIKAKDKWAYEPIHWAAYHDRPEIIELLIAKGADVNVKTSLGQTPLQLAIPRRNAGAIEVLRKHGAKE